MIRRGLKILSVLGLLALSSCDNNEGEVWNASLPWSVKEYHTTNAIDFAAAVEKETGGALEIKVFPGGVLGLKGPDTMLVTTSDELIGEAERVAEELRSYGISSAVNLARKKLGDQIAHADKKDVPTVLIIGEDELKDKIFTLRNLADSNEVKGSITELVSHIKASRPS